MEKQTVYVPVKIEEGLDTLSSTNGKGEKLIYVPEDITSEGAYSHWIKRQQAFVFTEEQLNELLSNVIKDTLETAYKMAELNTPTNDWQNRWIKKESILNTFEETYKKHKV